MVHKSAIEWTNATWNPVTGCKKISPGCDHCYAERESERWRGCKMRNGKPHPFTMGFDITERPERLDQPAQLRKPARIFVNSMSDLFLKEISPEFLDRIFTVMEQVPRHTYQVLTKRSSLMERYVRQRYSGSPVPAHIWMGVSVEDRQRRGRIAHLLRVNSPRRFISFEPLIGPVGDVSLKGIHWAICGGESGAGARPMEADWAREIRDICARDGTAFFFKQWSGYQVKKLGRKLDGREWNEYPPDLPGQQADLFTATPRPRENRNGERERISAG